MTERERFVRVPCLLCATLGLSACAPLLSLVANNQALIQNMVQIERIKLAGDGVSYVASSKTITDHALSMALGKDCKIFNLVAHAPVCKDKTLADKKAAPGPAPNDESQPQRAAQAAPDDEISATAAENSN